MSGQEKTNKTTRQRRRSPAGLLPAPVEAVIGFGFSPTLVLSEYEKLRSASRSRAAASAGSDAAAAHVTASALLTAVDDAVRHSSFSASSRNADDDVICHEYAEGISDTSFVGSPSCDCADDDRSSANHYTNEDETPRQCDNGAAATTTTAMCPPRDGTTSSTTRSTTDFAATRTTAAINPLGDGKTTPSTTSTTTNITTATTTAAMISPTDGTTPLTTAMTTGVAVVTVANSLAGGEASTTATAVITAGVPISEFPGGRNPVNGGGTSDNPAASDPNRDAAQGPSVAPTPAVQHSHPARDRSSERRERTTTRNDEPGERSRQVKRLRVLRAENRRLKARRLCRQCLERPVSLTLLPCGHFLFCTECGSSFTACPVCRKTILADVRTFVS